MRWLLFLGMPVALSFSFTVPPAKNFMEPELARMIFFHLPCAFGATIFAIFGSIASWAYLSKKTVIWEHRALAATEMALALAVATMLTGILFSKVQWGDWWHWDPRQTSFLIVLLLLGAYFAIRMAFEEETARARAAAAYSTVTLLPILFLIFVFPRLPQVRQNSLHPSTTVQEGGFSTDYWMVILGVFVLLMWTCIWLYRMHVKSSQLLLEHRNRNGNLDDIGSDTTAYRVDRSVPLR